MALGFGDHAGMAGAQNHKAHRFEYADATARAAAAGLTADDEGTLARQLDDDSFWVLTDYTGPTWTALAGAAASAAPNDATYITQTPNGSLSAEQSLSALSTGIVKNTTTTGVLSIAAEGTDYYGPGGTDVSITDGGTGASSAAAARTALGLAIGTDVQAQDATLAALAAYNTNGILAQTAADTFAGRTLTGTANQVTVANGDGVAGNPTLSLPTAARTRELNFLIDGGGSAIATGVKGDIRFAVAGTITAWTVLADQSGSIVIDLWKDTLANFPPTVADTITGAEKPTLSSQTNAEDTSLSGGSGWAVSAGDVVRVNVDSAATVTRVTLVLTFVAS